MNKKYIYIGLGLLAVGGAVYFLSKKKTESAVTDEVIDSAKVEPQVNVKMPVKKLRVVDGGKAKDVLNRIKASATSKAQSVKDKINALKRK